MKRIKGSLAAFPVGELTADERKTYDVVLKDFESYFAADDELAKQYRTGDKAVMDKADGMLNDGPVFAGFVAISENTAKLTQTIDARGAAQSEHAQQVSDRARLMLIATLAAVLLIGLLVTRTIATRMQRALAKVGRGVTPLGRGNLTVDIAVDSRR